MTVLAEENEQDGKYLGKQTLFLFLHSVKRETVAYYNFQKSLIEQRLILIEHQTGSDQECSTDRSQGFPGGSVVKNLTAKQEMQVRSLAQEDFPEEEMATHFSILAWEIPWTEEPGGLWSMGSQNSWTQLSV